MLKLFWRWGWGLRHAMQVGVKAAAGFLLLIGSMLVSTPAVAGEWIEVSSANFVVYSDADRERVIALVRDLELFRGVIGQITPIEFPEQAQSDPLIVFAYDSTARYQKESHMDGTAGVYLTRHGRPVSVLSLEEPEEMWIPAGREVLLHEYTHHLLHRYSPFNYPTWYDEGFAEYLSTIVFESNRVTLGRPPVSRLIVLRNVSDWVELETIIESNAGYLGDLSSGLTLDPNKDKLGIPFQYAQGWLLTHMLHSDADLRLRLGYFIAALNREGPSETEALFEKHFGMDINEMDRRLRKYWRALELPLLTVSLEKTARQVDPAVRSLEPRGQALIDDLMRARSGLGRHGRGMRKRLESALEEGYRPALVREHLARMALDDEKPERAASHVQALLDNHPDEIAGPVLEMRRLRRQAAEAPDDQTIARLARWCERALGLDENHVEALMLCVTADLDRPESVNATTLERVQRARARSPDDFELKRLEVRVLGALDRFDEAIELADRFAAWSRSSQAQRQFEQLARDVEKLKNQEQPDT